MLDFDYARSISCVLWLSFLCRKVNQNDGSYCVPLAPQASPFTVSVASTPLEKSKGILLSPPSYSVIITDAPILDLQFIQVTTRFIPTIRFSLLSSYFLFYQARVFLGGQVNCISTPCASSVRVVLTRKPNAGHSKEKEFRISMPLSERGSWLSVVGVVLVAHSLFSCVQTSFFLLNSFLQSTLCLWRTITGAGNKILKKSRFLFSWFHILWFGCSVVSVGIPEYYFPQF